MTILKKKSMKVTFADIKIKKAFAQLAQEDNLTKFIKRAIKDIEEDAFCGIQIPKRLIPKPYIQKYNINNF